MKEILTVSNLKVYFKSIYGDYKVLDGVSFSVFKNEIFGIAGESGCGKSTLAEGILRLIRPPGYIKEGKIVFEGVDLLKLNEAELRKIRFKKLSYIPQGSMNSLNPVLKIKEQVMDAIIDHTDIPKKDAEELAIAVLQNAGLPPKVADMYPHELSGGMKQRVVISIATALKPSLVIADEPVTALDVVTQRAILESIAEMREKFRTSIILIAHDMSVHAEIVDRLAIMYAGKIVEIGSIYDIFEQPLHPYTRLLIDSIPSLGKKAIKGIPGLAPSPLNWPPGCRFHERCPFSTDICKKREPALCNMGNEHYVACHLYGERK